MILFQLWAFLLRSHASTGLSFYTYFRKKYPPGSFMREKKRVDEYELEPSDKDEDYCPQRYNYLQSRTFTSFSFQIQ